MIVSSSESDLYKESLSEHSSEYSNESSFESSDNTDDAIYKYKDSKVDAASRTLWPCMKGGWKEIDLNQNLVYVIASRVNQNTLLCQWLI